MPYNPATARLHGRGRRRRAQTSPRLVATAAAVLADLIKGAFCASSAAQRNVNDGINGCGPPPAACRPTRVPELQLRMDAGFTSHLCSVKVSSNKCLLFLALH